MTAPSAGGASAAESRRDWQEWTRTNIRRVGIGAGLVVVTVGAVMAYLASERRKEEFAATALSQAWSTVEAGNMALGSSDLARLVERYGGTRAADEAFVLLSELRLLGGQDDIAVHALQQFVAQRHPKYYLASAFALLGGGLENLNRFGDAAKAYRSAAENAELSFLKAQYLIDASRAFVLARDTASAKAALGEVLQKYGSLSQSAEARVRMGEIGGEAPPPPPAPRRQTTDQGE